MRLSGGHPIALHTCEYDAPAKRQSLAVLPRLLFAVLFGIAALIWPVEAQASSESCPPGTHWESLCNVEPELRRSYLMIERVADLSYSRDRLSGMVRDRRLTIDWDWYETNRSHLGAFFARAAKVLIPAHVRGNPDRVVAAILAHELWHAYTSSQGLHSPPTRSGCLEDEKSAFVTGVQYYHRFRGMSEVGPRPRSEVDAYFMSLDDRWRQGGGDSQALERLANEHLAKNGYVERCGQYSR